MPFDYRAYSASGTLIHTFSHEYLARRWAMANAEQYPGLRIEKVCEEIRSEVVYRPRPRLRVVGA